LKQSRERSNKITFLKIKEAQKLNDQSVYDLNKRVSPEEILRTMEEKFEFYKDQ